jgi:hypothetical protein
MWKHFQQFRLENNDDDDDNDHWDTTAAEFQLKGTGTPARPHTSRFEISLDMKISR